MKKIICLLIVLALAPALHADNKKKKPEASHGPAHAPSLGGGRSGALPGMGRTTGRSSAPRPSTHASQKFGSHSSPGASNPLTQKSHTANGATRSSNPLLRKGGQPASNPLSQSGTNKTNPLTKKGGAQANLNGARRNPLANKNNSLAAQNRGNFARNGRSLNNRGAGNWTRRNHANYRVRNSREVFRNYRPLRHDRIWYTSRYDRVVVVGGGYYYWDAGYWYPALGYDPAISFYAYEGPIYSYDNLPPDQVTMNVQTALQDAGYYTGDIDGLVGPKTRDALGAYQTDHNLEVTSAVDEPTVEALGLTENT